jgi:type II secretory pathway pseudopilin PulG
MSPRSVIDCRRPRRREVGLSLVELMVGIAIGLFIVAAATMVVSSQLSDNRRLLLEVQVQQDMRASLDVITREIRRSGLRDLPELGLWREGFPPVANVFADISLHDSGREIRFDYHRGVDLPNLGYRFNTTSGSLQTRIGGNWQDLTDASTMRVTHFEVIEQAPIVHLIPCPRACSAANPANTDCWPRLRVRSYVVELAAEARADATIARTLRTEVRVRNDRIERQDGTPAAMECPA